MTQASRVRLAAELAVGDVVRTPMERRARVVRHFAGRVVLQYLDWHGSAKEETAGANQVVLRPDWVTLESKAVPHYVSPAFFKGEAK